ncbi:SUMO ligase siz1 [Podila verticillata]|nr:SUMO ligase siz1 [Podila verticillata]
MEDLTTITGRIIPGLLVNQLKALIKSLNETIRPAPHLKLGGNKAELIYRLTDFIVKYHQIGDQVVIRQIRQCVRALNQGEVATIITPVHPGGNGSSYRIPGSMLTSKPNPGQPSSSHGTSSNNKNSYYPQSQPPHQYPPQQQPQHSSLAGGSSQMIKQVFKSSPFYRDIQTLCPPKLCVEAKDRTLSTPLHFTMQPMVATQMKRDPDFQLMVFCGWADSSPQHPVLMEFPSVCEIKVNGRVLEANLRGMKNKPGTVSPANITRLCRLENADYNKVEFIYANSTKRYYASTHVVKKISVQSIVAEIEHGKFLSKEKMLQMIEDRNKDDDIMATSSTLSLKCPLGFQRINIPCRSSYCHHLQCFDGITFFELNEQTPTWTCPVCSRVMHSWEEIVVDGYFKDILNSTPKSLESVTVQADGAWEIPASIADQTEVDNSPKKKAVDPASVFLLDDDSEDEDETPQAPPTPVRPTKPVVEVIDLISDSEDEDDSEPALPDTNGDSVMQEAANSLQNMAHSSAPHSVKTEIVDKATPTGTEGRPPPEIYSVATSTHASPTASSEDSPVISTRMVTEGQPGPPPPRHDPVGWDSGNADMFMNALLNPRRKRQFEDTGDTETLATNDARQRIARLNIRSSASSDRSSAVPSPDIIRRSTSSPTPVPIQDYYFQQSEGEDRRRPSRELFLNAGHYVENGFPGGGTTNPYRRDSPQHRQNSLGSSRSVTKSPPHHIYNTTMAPHQTDYYNVISRPPSAGPLTMQGRSGSSVIASRNVSGASSGPHYSGSTGWASPDGHSNDRPYKWPSESSHGSTAAPQYPSHSTNSTEGPHSRPHHHQSSSSSNVYSNGETPSPGEPYPGRPHPNNDANYFQGMRGARAR